MGARSAIGFGLIAAVALALAAPAQGVGPEEGLERRGWELVSPAKKGDGQIAVPAGLGQGAFQAAEGGGAIAYASTAAFAEPKGAAPVNQYLSLRSAGGWSTENLVPPLVAGAYEDDPHLLFSADLSTAILTGPTLCPNGAPTCPAPEPPLAPGGPTGYRNLYRQSEAGTEPLVTAANSPSLTVPATEFELALAGASADLTHVLFSTCAALIPGAVQVPAGPGCDPSAQNLYLYTAPAATLRLINVLPGESQSAPGAAPAIAPGSPAVSEDGDRVYWRGADGNLYLRGEAGTVQVDAALGGDATLEAAAVDGARAVLAKDGHLYLYRAAQEDLTDLLPGGGLQTFLGASATATHLLYKTAAGVFLWREGFSSVLIGSALRLGDLSPASSAVSADGSRLFFTTQNPQVPADTNAATDAYVWQPDGEGGCEAPVGCTSLLSDGRRAGNSRFLAASADGADAFLLTENSLVGADPGGRDVYDARVEGGFAEPADPVPCVADACQGAPQRPERPFPTSTLFGNRDGNFASVASKRCKRAGAKAAKATQAKRPCKKRGSGKDKRRRGGSR